MYVILTLLPYLLHFTFPQNYKIEKTTLLNRTIIFSSFQPNQQYSQSPQQLLPWKEWE